MSLLFFSAGLVLLGIGIYLLNMGQTVWEITKGVMLGLAGVVVGVVSVFVLALVFNRQDLGFYLLGMVVVPSGLTFAVWRMRPS